MSTVKILSFIFLIVIVESCCDRCRDNEGSYYSYDLETNIFKDGKRISYQYDSVIAIGLKDSIFRYIESERFKADNDSLFKLRLSIHNDTTTFVFIDRFLSRDTVSITYRIEYFQDWYSYYARFVNMRIAGLSSRLSKDSTIILDDNSSGVGRTLKLCRK